MNFEDKKVSEKNKSKTNQEDDNRIKNIVVDPSLRLKEMSSSNAFETLDAFLEKISDSKDAKDFKNLPRRSIFNVSKQDKKPNYMLSVSELIEQSKTVLLRLFSAIVEEYSYKTLKDEIILQEQNKQVFLVDLTLYKQNCFYSIYHAIESKVYFLLKEEFVSNFEPLVINCILETFKDYATMNESVFSSTEELIDPYAYVAIRELFKKSRMNEQLFSLYDKIFGPAFSKTIKVLESVKDFPVFSWPDRINEIYPNISDSDVFLLKKVFTISDETKERKFSDAILKNYINPMRKLLYHLFDPIFNEYLAIALKNEISLSEQAKSVAEHDLNMYYLNCINSIAYNLGVKLKDLFKKEGSKNQESMVVDKTIETVKEFANISETIFSLNKNLINSKLSSERERLLRISVVDLTIIDLYDNVFGPAFSRLVKILDELSQVPVSKWTTSKLKQIQDAISSDFDVFSIQKKK